MMCKCSAHTVQTVTMTAECRGSSLWLSWYCFVGCHISLFSAATETNLPNPSDCCKLHGPT